jgi:hypothetical protein
MRLGDAARRALLIRSSPGSPRSQTGPRGSDSIVCRRWCRALPAPQLALARVLARRVAAGILAMGSPAIAGYPLGSHKLSVPIAPRSLKGRMEAGRG